MPGIRKIAPDHRLSWPLVQEALVLSILCILCIDVNKCNKPVLLNLSYSGQAMNVHCFTLV